MPLLPLVAAVVNPPYAPKVGDGAVVYTHYLKPEMFPGFVEKALAGIKSPVNRRIPANAAYQLADASHFTVMGVVFTPDRPKYELAWSRSPELVAHAKRLAAMHATSAFPVDRGNIISLDFGAGQPKIGNIVYLYIHTAKPGRFAALKASFESQVPQKFRKGFSPFSHFTLADPAKGRVLSYVFYPNQKAADDLHRNPERARIIAASAANRSSYAVERYVLAGTR